MARTQQEVVDEIVKAVSRRDCLFTLLWLRELDPAAISSPSSLSNLSPLEAAVAPSPLDSLSALAPALVQRIANAHELIIQILLLAGADPALVGRSGRSAFDWAAAKQDRVARSVLDEWSHGYMGSWEKAAHARALPPYEGLEPWLHENDLDVIEAIDLLSETQLPSPAETPSLSPPASLAPASPPAPAPVATRFAISNLPLERDLAQNLKDRLEEFTRTGSVCDVQVTEGNLRASAVVAIDLSRVADPDQALANFVRSAPFGDKYEIALLPYIEPSEPSGPTFEPPAGQRGAQIFVSGIAARSHPNEVLLLIQTRVRRNLVDSIKLYPAALPSTSQVAFVTLSPTADVDHALHRLQDFNARLHHSTLKFSLNQEERMDATFVPKNYYPPRQPRPLSASPPPTRRSRSPATLRPSSNAQLYMSKVDRCATLGDVRLLLERVVAPTDVVEIVLQANPTHPEQVAYVTFSPAVDFPSVLHKLRQLPLNRPRFLANLSNDPEVCYRPPLKSRSPPAGARPLPVSEPVAGLFENTPLPQGSFNHYPEKILIRNISGSTTSLELRRALAVALPASDIFDLKLEDVWKHDRAVRTQIAHLTLRSSVDVPHVLRELQAKHLRVNQGTLVFETTSSRLQPEHAGCIDKQSLPPLSPPRPRSRSPTAAHASSGPQLFVSKVDRQTTAEDLRLIIERVVPPADVVTVALQPHADGVARVAYVTLDPACDMPSVLRDLGALKLSRPRFSANLASDPYLAPTRLESYRPLDWLPPGAQLFVSRISAESTEDNLRKALEPIVPAHDLVDVALRPAPGEVEGQVAYLTLSTAVDVRQLVRKFEQHPVDLDSSRLTFDVLKANPLPEPATAASRPRSRSPTRSEDRSRYRDSERSPEPRPTTYRRRSHERSPTQTRLSARRAYSPGRSDHYIVGREFEDRRARERSRSRSPPRQRERAYHDSSTYKQGRFRVVPDVPAPKAVVDEGTPPPRTIAATPAPDAPATTAAASKLSLREAALLPAHSDLPLLTHPTDIFLPLSTPPSDTFSRTLPLSTTFGYLPPAIASRALAASSSPLFPADPGVKARFIAFLEAQIGTSMAHYDDFLEEVDQFSKRNREMVELGTWVEENRMEVDK